MWSALFNSHLYSTVTCKPNHVVTSIQQSPVNLTMWSLLFNSHLYSTVTSIQQSPLFKSPVLNSHLYSMVTCIEQSPVLNSHLYWTVTSIQQSHLFNSHQYYKYFLLIKIRNYWYMYIFIQVKEESFNCCSAFHSQQWANRMP